MESALRVAVLACGAKVLAGLLAEHGSGRREEAVLCRCGQRMESQGVRRKELMTILGPVAYDRSRFQCPSCQATRYPGDEAMDVEGTTRSPGLRRMMARAGSQSTFKDARDDLRIYAGLDVSAKDVERVAERIGQEMESWSERERQEILSREEHPEPEKDIPVMYVSYDGTGVPMTRWELVGVKGKRADGVAKTREAKLGCVFTQTTVDEEGYPIRDPDTTSFVGAIETAETFGWRIYGEAWRQGLSQARKVVVLGDGAEWVKNLAEMHFPRAILIIDLYHARQHVSGLCRILFGANEKKMERQRRRWWALLDGGRVENIILQARRHLPFDPDLKKTAETEIHYLEKNKERMRYVDFRAQGLFVGSGVIEAGCKTIIGQRLKQSGMEWTVRGANAIISLRCMMKSNRLEDYWESRVA
ncbi:MAG: ISKra4 family transposase [Candidatus Aminicenantes bacterium]|nr:ISKra4 family transposase [Candidatus Aminicenantes bacterium]